MNKPDSVQQVVPDGACDRENGEGSSERAVPAEVAALEAALRDTKKAMEGPAATNSELWWKLSDDKEALTRSIEIMRLRAATGGNAKLSDRL
jgi:hypothetical protein